MVHILTQTLKLLTIVVTAVLIVFGGMRVFTYALDVARPAEAGEVVSFTVNPDEDSAAVAERLVDAGLLRYAIVFDGQLRLSGPLEAGEYRLRKGMSADQIIDRITGEVVETPAPEVASSGPAETVDFTVNEGWRIAEMAELYEQLGGEGGAPAFEEAVANINRSQFDFLTDVPADTSLEGYLFPSTYSLRLDDPTLLVATMLSTFDQQVTPEMRARADSMGLSLREVLTFASLVEKEAVLPAERPTIADVYISRYEQGWNLEADPTIQYVIGYRDGRWWPELTGADLENTESPYNTYKNGGLPPGPIASPGLASIVAVLEPAETDFMFFVAKQDGSNEHAFAVTKEEQDANVDLYLNTPSE